MHKFRNVWRWFAIIWALFILWVSVIPAADLPSLSLWEADKFAHAAVYLLLTIFVSMALKKYSVSITAGLCLLYGIILEIIQGQFLPSRTFDYYDIIANTFGCISGIFVILLIRRMRNIHRA